MTGGDGLGFRGSDSLVRLFRDKLRHGGFQVFAPDIFVASRTGRVEAGIPLWKRLAYVAITRAERELRWVVNNRLKKPSGALGTADLKAPAVPLELREDET